MAKRPPVAKRRLGRGLGSLIQNPVRVQVPQSAPKRAAASQTNDHVATADTADQSSPPANASSIQSSPQEKEMPASTARPLAPAAYEVKPDVPVSAASSTTATTSAATSTPDDPTPPRPDVTKPMDDDPTTNNPQSTIPSAARMDDANPADDNHDDDDDDAAVRITMLPLAAVHANPDQPRKRFDEETLNALAESIRTAGLMQPIVVRQRGGQFQIIAGERRWRAAQIVGLAHIPAIVRELDDRQVAEWSLIENLQREDLNPIEKATAFQRLLDEFNQTHQQIADSVGVNRVTVSNHLRLLELDSSCTELVRSGLLDLGHAKALLGLTNIAKRQGLAARAIREGWSVRSLEQEVRRIEQGLSGGAGGAAAGHGEDGSDRDPASGTMAPLSGRTAHLRDLEKQLSEYLGTRVAIRLGRRAGTGKLVVDFFSAKQFEGMLDRMKFTPK